MSLYTLQLHGGRICVVVSSCYMHPFHLWVCETYVVHYLNRTGLRCAAPTCLVHHGALGGPTGQSQSLRSKVTLIKVRKGKYSKQRQVRSHQCNIASLHFIISFSRLKCVISEVEPPACTNQELKQSALVTSLEDLWFNYETFCTGVPGHLPPEDY